MILTLGILVDTTIVIVEGIQHNLQQGLSRKDAAIKSVSDVGGPIITATVTTILVFIPIAMMGGVTGEFIKFIPYTVITVLSGALLIALTIIPFLGKSLLKLSRREENKIEKDGSAEWNIIKRYTKRLRNIINSRSKKVLVLVISIVLLFISLSLPATDKVKIDLWPEELDMDFFQIAVEYPKNTSDQIKDDIIKNIGDKIEELHQEDDEISQILLSYAPFSLYGGPFATGGGQDTMIVKLTDMRTRKLTSSDVIDKLNSKFDQIEGAEIKASNFSMGPPASEFPVEVQITSKDLETAKTAATDLAKYLRGLDEIEEVEDGVEDEKAPQIQINIDQIKLSQLGVPAIQVAQIVRNIYQPEKVSELFDNKSNTNIDIYLDTQDTENKIDKLKELVVLATPQGTIKLSDVSEIRKVEEIKSINHYEGDRFIEVKASLKEGIDSNAITNKINDYLDNDKLEELSLEKNAITFRGEFEEEENAFNDFTEAFVMAMLLIFMVLVFQFKSFLQPFIIMLAIPLSMIGVFFGLYITGNPVSFLGMLGIIALAGIVVNDSIVLIDRFNKLRAEGKGLKEAVVEGTRLRTRPVLSTSITTIGGILPLTLTISFWKPLGVAMISGLIASTILTLVVTPTIYYSVTSLTSIIFRKK
jgi:HAE1 family hydrophobic/amphiphilic exporter-1